AAAPDGARPRSRRLPEKPKGAGMSRRTLTILSGAVVVLVVLAFIGQQGPRGTVASSGALLLPGLEERLNDVERLTLTGPGGETVATAEVTDEGWVIVEKDRYRANLQQIREGMLALAQARVVEAKTANPELYDRLGVEDIEVETAGGMQISIEGAGEPLVLIVGDAEGADHRYVRIAGEARSYLIDGDPDLPDNAADWLDQTILGIDPSRVRRVVVRHADGETVEVTKSTPEQTTFAVEAVPEGRELLYTGVANSIANVLRNLR